jgi:predicted metal-dependent enzyme (double-stranded beta helix superfamily)
MFDTDQFIADCRSAIAEDDGHKAIREMVTRAVDDPNAVLKALGEPTEAGLHTLYCDDRLTILNLVWAPLMTLQPHNHNMWAVIGLYTGREDNIFWRRDGSHIEAAGAKALSVKEVAPLGKDIIHSVTNPVPRLTGALHVYGGDFFGVPRSEWDPESLEEQAYDVEKARRTFAEANARFSAG